MRLKSCFSLIELIVSLIISSLLIVVSMQSYWHFHSIFQTEYNTTVEKLQLFNTQLFLERNLNANTQNQLKYKKPQLFFDNALLATNIKEFSLQSSGSLLRIKICQKSCVEFYCEK